MFLKKVGFLLGKIKSPLRLDAPSGASHKTHRIHKIHKKAFSFPFTEPPDSREKKEIFVCFVLFVCFVFHPQAGGLPGRNNS